MKRLKKQATATLLSKETYSYYDIDSPYDIPDYEIIYLYTYQALNYLSIGNILKAQSSLDNLGVAGIWVDKQKNASWWYERSN